MTTVRTGACLVPVYEQRTATLDALEHELRAWDAGFAQVSSPEEFKLVALPLTTALPEQTFEVTAHGAAAEVRWRRTGTGGGTLVEVRDVVDDEAHECLEHSELLWGTVSSTTGSGTVLHSPRIGTLDVPLAEPAVTGAGVVVDVRRYVALDPHGNAYVADQRLLGLRPVNGTTEEGR